MGRRVLILIVLLAAFSVAQGLKCYRCQRIDKYPPFCEQLEEHECPKGLTHCIKLTMLEPAYGEVRRCATTVECEASATPRVQKECCTTDLCN